jgi:peptidoglycan/LPS O-acetylase OafA/YrhL
MHTLSVKRNSQPVLPIRVNFGQRLISANGHPSGFDYLRLFLATAVLIWHTLVISYGIVYQNEVWAGPYRVLPALILPMFFALSGFLVAGSLDRADTIFRFLCLRVLRIFPALTAEVLLTGLVMGPLVTSLTFRQYFVDPNTWAYFFTTFGEVKTLLPGVFESNPLTSVVNGQLWTIPFELKCYATLGGLALIGVYRRPKLFLLLTLLCQLAFGARAVFGPPAVWAGVPAHVLFLCFISGAAINLFRNIIPSRWYLALLSSVLALGLVYIPGGGYFVPFPVAYLTVYLGLFNIPKTVVVASGDYSYGIYLYAFPIQQLVASIRWADFWYYNLLLSLPITFGVAVVSWHCLEKRALAQRNFIGPWQTWIQSGLHSRFNGKFGLAKKPAIAQATSAPVVLNRSS